MGGSANVDDNVLYLPGDTYRAVPLWSCDSKTNEWSIWWLNGRNVFYANDALNGKPIRVRFLWSKITTTLCRWEQAFSPDGGAHWETTWTMDLSPDINVAVPVDAPSVTRE